ncbi:AI-2E family transporter [Falsiroseomonas oryziterrae]|uniref:AI-2E family transporter n=1 Tax=Falsiroseomonas oryziterrae TaxID=2911368 RepID=UPI001F1B6337|nr:AI-2E family transporter [Roseomonas sp. NPKOSM-4]
MQATERRLRPGGAHGAAAVTPWVAASVIVAALYLGRDLLVPLALAVILAFVLAPLAGGLRRIGLGNLPATLLAVLAGVAVMLGIAFIVLRQLASLAGELSAFAGNLRAKLDRLRLDELVGQAMRTVDGLRDIFGSDASRGATAAAPVQTTEATPLEMAASWLGPVLAPVATLGIVVIFALFILLYRENLRDRLIRLAGVRDLHRTVGALDDAAYRLSRLFLAQLMLNAGFAVAIGSTLWLVGLPGAPLWGILAGLMRFVPFVGTPIAVLPPTLLALAAEPGWGLALAVGGLFLLAEALMGQVAEPLVFGRSAGLSPLSVIVAATFWTFMWGPIGLLLATPLTVCLVVLGRHVPRLEFLDVMLSDRPPLQPAESFYQRALEGDADALVAQARAALKEGTSLVAWHDDVALRGLALAEADWSREVLEEPKLDAIRQQVETLLDELAETPPAGSAAMPPEWLAEGAVLCIAGRGRLDDLSAAIAAQGLRHEAIGAVPLPNGTLEGDEDARFDPTRVRACVLSVLEEGSSAAAIRYFLRRIARRLPGVPVVVALWHAPSGSATLAELRQERGGASVIATSLGEVVAFCHAAAGQAAVPSGPANEPVRGGAVTVA